MMRPVSEAQPLEPCGDDAPRVRPEDLPVVARMVVEIRSDGVNTMARGALEDLVSGQNVAIETQPMGTLQLSAALAKALLATPALATRSALKTLVPRRLRRLKERLFKKPRAPDDEGPSS